MELTAMSKLPLRSSFLSLSLSLEMSSFALVLSLLEKSLIDSIA